MMIDVSTLIGSTEAARTLGVTKSTLYAYVSRGIVQRQLAVDGRTSLYDRGQIEGLATRSRRRRPVERPSIDVQISTGITQLDDASPSYRGHRIVDLVGRSSFEQVAELLLTGSFPDDDTRWPVDRELLERARSMVAAAGTTDPITALGIACAPISPDGDPAEAALTARELLGIAPSILGGPITGCTSSRLARAWVRRPSDELVAAIECALILLADHELATSTLAVRVAASVRACPSAALATGLNVVSGPFHGRASRASAELFDRAAEIGARGAVTEVLDGGGRLPGFGHTVYRTGDPRFEPLLSSVRAIPADGVRHAVVDDVISEAGRAIGHLPNVDLGLGALCFVGGLPVDAPLFAVARIAGWAAHYLEEIDERPVRFRGLARER